MRRARFLIGRAGAGSAAALGVGALLAAGCGSQSDHGATIAIQRTAGRASARGSAPADPPNLTGRAAEIARADVSSDRIITEGKVQIAAGAPSNGEVKRELEALRKEGVAIPKGDTVEAFEEGQAESSTAGLEIQVPQTPWNPRRKPIADWIVPILEWASEHGWNGTVTSGYRTFYEQAQLNAAGAYSAPAGLSNHETTKYPGGAVDVTGPGKLIVVLRGYQGPLKLVGGVLGAIDPEHFSATGD